MSLGSGIRNKPIPDPGSRGQKGTRFGSRIRIRNTDCMALIHTIFLCAAKHPEFTYHTVFQKNVQEFDLYENNAILLGH
jgi:hypothetical protein